MRYGGNTRIHNLILAMPSKMNNKQISAQSYVIHYVMKTKCILYFSKLVYSI